MDRTSVNFVARISPFSRARSSAIRSASAVVSVSASAFIISACAPLPPATTAELSPAPTAPAPKSQFPNKRSSAPNAGPLAEQHIPVGSANGYHTEVVITPPKQVCDLDAFSDGVQYGYAYTWNRLTLEQARDPAKRPATPPAQFDPSSIQSQDEQYKIVWNGTQRVNACASDGYLIGRIVGTHRAYIDMKGGTN